MQAKESIVYPNPATNFVQVALSMKYSKATLQIMDISGKMIFEQILNTNSQRVDISKIPSGTYVYRIFNYEGMDERGKIIVE